LLAVLVVGCSSITPARVVEVSALKRTSTVETVDKPIFLHDRASQFRFTAHKLPASEQREEFFVRWAGPAIALVKFEYRQVNRPGAAGAQSFAPVGTQSSHVFQISGDNFVNGGEVSAWRVSLWSNPEAATPLAEKKSALW
jgi:hypothetical protein